MDMVDALKKEVESERLGHHFMSGVKYIRNEKLTFVTMVTSDSIRSRGLTIFLTIRTCRDLLLPGRGATEGLARLTSTLTNDPEAEKSKLFSSVARLSTTERTLLFPLPMKNMGFLVSARARFWCCLFLQGVYQSVGSRVWDQILEQILTLQALTTSHRLK